MTQSPFQIAFERVLAQSGRSISDVAQATGIPVCDLQALQQDAIAACDVSDAEKVAGFFGLTLVDLLGVAELKDQAEIAALYNQLPQHLKAQYLASQPTATEASDPSAPE